MPKSVPSLAARGKQALAGHWFSILVGMGCLAPFTGLMLADGRMPTDGPSRDFVLYQLPIHAYARREMLAGHFPLWIADLGAGLPLHAGQQASLCHPLLTPFVLACGAGHGLKLCLLLHVAMAYIGTCCLARFHAASDAGAALAGLVATWSGFAINHLMAGHVNLILQYALVPWFLLAMAALLWRPSAPPALALAAVACCMALSGHPQVFYYAILYGTLWAIGSMLHGSAKVARVRTTAWLVIAASVAVLASSIQVLPSLELAQEGTRESFRSESGFSAQHCLTGLDMARFAAPNLVGNPFVGPRGFGAGESFHERVVYLGIPAAILALYGLSRARVERWQWGAAWLSVFALAISLGDSTPLFGWFICVLPGLGLFRCPGRVFGVASTFTALLAARGLDNLIHGERSTNAEGWLAWLTVVWSAITLVCTALAENADRVDWRTCLDYIHAHIVHTALPAVGAAAGVAAALFTAWRAGRRAPMAAYFVALVAAFVDLGWHNARNFSLERPIAVMLPESLVVRGFPIRFVESPIGGHMLRSQLRYSHLVPAAVRSGRQLLGTKEGGILPAETERLFRAVQLNPRVSLAVAACDYACRPFDGHCDALPGALPRLRLFAESDAALLDVPCEEMDESDLRRMRQALMGMTAIKVEEPQRIAIDVTAPRDGRLMLADTWYPGWNAKVDGADTEIERAHGVFRAVRVPAGSHRVVFSYKPMSFSVGVAASAIGAATWCALVVVALLNMWARQGRLIEHRAYKLPFTRSIT